MKTLKNILDECIRTIKNEGWNLPDNIKIKVAYNYYKDKPLSPSYVDRRTNTVYVMSTIKNEKIIKRLVLHELIHLTDPDNYSHNGSFKSKTDKLNKKYNFNLPYAAEDTLEELFNKIPSFKKQAYQIVSKNSGVPISDLSIEDVIKKAPNKITK